MSMKFATVAEQLFYETNILEEVSEEEMFTEYVKSVKRRLNEAPWFAKDLRAELIRNYMVYSGRMTAAGRKMPSTYINAVYGPSGMPVVEEILQNGGAVPESKPVVTKTGSKKAEYAVGAIVLSVLGSLLILIGFATLAINFFNDLWQGLTLYIVFLALLLGSELALRKYVKPLSMVISGLSFVGMIVTTMVCYFKLNVFNLYVAVGLLFAITLAIAVYGRIRRSTIFKYVGIVSSYVATAFLYEVGSESEFYILGGFIILLAAVWTFLPEEKYPLQISGVLMGLTTFYLTFLTPDNYGFSFYNKGMNIVAALMLTVGFILLMFMLYIGCVRFYGNFSEGRKKGIVGISIVYFICSVILALLTLAAVSLAEKEYRDVTCIISVVIAAVPAVIITNLMLKEKMKTAIHILISFSVFSLFVAAGATDSICFAIVSAFLLILVTVMDRIWKNITELKVCDLLVKLVVALMAIFYSSMYGYEIASYIMLAAVIFGFMIGSGFVTVSEIILNAALILGLCMLLPSSVGLIVAAGIIFISMFAVHWLKYLQKKGLLAFDIYNLVALLTVMSCINLKMYRYDMLSILVIFIFGLGTLFILCSPKCNMFFKGKIWPLAVYLTYFILVLRIKENFITSAILMAVALLLVALGFLLKQLSARIVGLVLAVSVCLKLVFYDFLGADTLLKTIMYFVAGFLAILIGAIYIIVEMKISKKQGMGESASGILQDDVNSATISNNYEE